jgi:hypothetical protein
MFCAFQINLRFDPSFTFFSFVLIQKKQKIKAVMPEPKITTQNLNLKNSPFTFFHRIDFGFTTLI